VPLDRSVPTSDLTRTIADEAAAYLEIADHVAAIKWFLEASELDLGTTLDQAARHMRLAIGAAEKARLT
jgi:hypothetical protein